jgi:hypothetical protein
LSEQKSGLALTAAKSFQRGPPGKKKVRGMPTDDIRYGRRLLRKTLRMAVVGAAVLFCTVLIGTVIRIFTAHIVVPIQWIILNKLPEDGSDVCRDVIGN